jgi:NADH-quinone oxidoreductase subunit L
VLAVLSTVGGYLFNVPKILNDMFPIAEEPHDPMLLIVSIAAGLIGIAIAWYMYVANTELPDRIAESARGLYTLLYNKYFVDEIYDATVVHPIVEGSTTVLWRGVDQGVIDGAVNGIGYQSRGIGSVLRLVQSGSIRSYATWVVLGSVAVIVVMGVIGRSF